MPYVFSHEWSFRSIATIIADADETVSARLRAMGGHRTGD
jgi:hypothetical protein